MQPRTALMVGPLLFFFHVYPLEHPHKFHTLSCFELIFETTSGIMAVSDSLAYD